MASLFDPIRLGAVTAPNRIFMAPLTRARATRTFVPTPLMAEYYRQRASAGLIISEATAISRQGMGWPCAPGLWTDEQVDGWRVVTDAVRDAGGRMVAQLWHMGRQVHPDYLGGSPQVAPSAIAAPGRARTFDGPKPHAVPRALAREEIPGVVEDYRRAAANAMAAGFDGVQIHAANGYLIDQFLRDSSNQRNDGYGGPVANRVRFLSEVTAAVVSCVGADRVSVRLSPTGGMAGVEDSDPQALFSAAVGTLEPFGLAFLELREPGPDSGFHGGGQASMAPMLRPLFTGPLVLNSDYRPDTAQAALDAGTADAVSFGRLFLANPDLPSRVAHHALLAEGNDKETWYAGGARGYTDFPAADAA